MWKNDGKVELFVVKRKGIEVYHTGGYRTGNQPQLYKIGHAKSAVKQLNKQDAWSNKNEMLSFDDWLASHPHWASKPEELDRFYEYYETYKQQWENPWVVAVVQFSSTEYEE